MKIIVFLAILAAAFAAKARYDNYKVVTLHVATADQYEAVMQLEKMGYLYMDPPHGVGHSAHIVVPPHKLAEFDEIVQKYNFKSQTMMENLQETINNEVRAAPDADFGWTSYHTLGEIYEWMDEIQQKYPEQVTVMNIGKSYEGRDIKCLKISFREGNPGIFLESNIHAREWVTSATATWIINLLLTSEDIAVRNFAFTIDWYFVVVANPDGFVYTHTTNRLWRKTRKPTIGSCFGTDPNRNWDFQWMTGGSSSDGCSDIYAGPSAFSEPETKAISDFYTSIADKITMYGDFHSFSQYLMYPYGCDTAGNITNRAEHDEVGLVMQQAIAERYGTEYEMGDIVNVIYVASGGSVDWIKGVHDTKFVYVWEFRDTGRYGFVLPADQIIPNSEEVWDSFVAMLYELRRRGYFPQQ